VAVHLREKGKLAEEAKGKLAVIVEDRENAPTRTVILPILTCLPPLGSPHSHAVREGEADFVAEGEQWKSKRRWMGFEERRGGPRRSCGGSRCGLAEAKLISGEKEGKGKKENEPC
jgi:hypothetical protein